MPDGRTGIYKHGAGWRAVVSCGSKAPQVTRHFPADTPFSEMQDWRKDEQAKWRLARGRNIRRPFLADTKRYLDAISALPTIKERRRHLALWAEVFGHLRRDQITPVMIRAQRDRWLREPRATGQPPLAPGTVNRRLRALSNLFTVLDGPKADNPVRHVEEAHEPEPLAKDLDYDTIHRILDEIPDLGQCVKGESRSDVNLTKIRLTILAYTGLPASQLMRLTPEDVDLDAATMRLPARRKGAGQRGVLLPLLPQAAEAFARLKAHNAFGGFSTSSMWKTFDRAAKRAKVTGASPYTLRHSFLTVVLDVTGSLDAVMAFAQHASPKMAQRYTQRAAARLLQQRAGGLARAIGKRSPGEERKTLEKSGVGETISRRVKEGLSRAKTAKTGA